MEPIKVLAIFGTRPEAIKMAPVVQELERRGPAVRLSVCVTGQHRQMLDQVLSLFHIRPDYDLEIMRENQTPSQVAARVLLALDDLLADLAPDWALVQGDTTTVMAASIAAHHRRVKVGHVEAGLRTYDRANPFPEEMNRVVADHVSDMHFAPTPLSRANLLREGVSPQGVFVTGNTVIDALRWIADQPPTPEVQSLLKATQDESGKARSLVLVTAHRRENFGKPIREIFTALRTLAERQDVHIIYPVHLNPNVWEPAHELLGGISNITLLPPVDYLLLVHLMKHSRLILTDSGGIQEEAPSLGVPVLVLREATERPEAVEAGVARVVGTRTASILEAAVTLLDDPAAHARMSQAANPYGDGQAACRIVDALLTRQCEEFSPAPTG